VDKPAVSIIVCHVVFDTVTAGKVIEPGANIVTTQAVISN